MISRRLFGAQIGAAALVAGCGGPRGQMDGKPITALIVMKARRRLYVMSGSEILRDYPMELGFAPDGHKQFEGDGKTPEGTYRIDRRNPQSAYYLSLGLSYPNRRDWEYARAQGKSPGGDIFIHGTPRRFIGRDDWTAGCIAVSNLHMEQLFRAVEIGTLVQIEP